MNTEQRVDRVLESWFADGPSELPDHTIQSIVNQLETNEQRGRWLPGRQEMNRMILAIGGAALIVVLALGAGMYFGYIGNGPGVGVQPTSAPPATTEPTDTREPTPEPSTQPSVTASLTPQEMLPEGPHVLWNSPLGITISVRIPAPGWYGEPERGILTKNHNVDAPDGAGLMVFARTNDLLVGLGDVYVYGDPCHWESTKPDTPITTVDEAIAALSGQVSRDASAPEDVTLGGYAGKRITLHVPNDVVFSDCDGGEFRTLVEAETVARSHQDPDQFDLLWILDVKGELVIFDLAYYQGTPRSVLDELAAILESATLDYPPFVCDDPDVCLPRPSPS